MKIVLMLTNVLFTTVFMVQVVGNVDTVKPRFTDTHLIQTLFITTVFLVPLHTLPLKLTRLIRTLCNTNTLSDPNGVCNNRV